MVSVVQMIIGGFRVGKRTECVLLNCRCPGSNALHDVTTRKTLFRKLCVSSSKSNVFQQANKMRNFNLTPRVVENFPFLGLYAVYLLADICTLMQYYATYSANMEAGIAQSV